MSSNGCEADVVEMRQQLVPCALPCHNAQTLHILRLGNVVWHDPPRQSPAHLAEIIHPHKRLNGECPGGPHWLKNLLWQPPKHGRPGCLRRSGAPSHTQAAACRLLHPLRVAHILAVVHCGGIGSRRALFTCREASSVGDRSSRLRCAAGQACMCLVQTVCRKQLSCMSISRRAGVKPGGLAGRQAGRQLHWQSSAWKVETPIEAVSPLPVRLPAHRLTIHIQVKRQLL